VNKELHVGYGSVTGTEQPSMNALNLPRSWTVKAPTQPAARFIPQRRRLVGGEGNVMLLATGDEMAGGRDSYTEVSETSDRSHSARLPPVN
jgi:hypothetical protein